ncbi:gluconokinase [Algoriphagus sp. D3-2-R+10]|uniref:gluconokinase n=1 Tax=Algoriphagus aurantiacus TaxID=3103948 RepID=UPI002B3CB59E|nr:gluconokinase [Algoriphagus sp. D3-2-R+10]MEB2775961.1 gluconokinase [Algoriphagus sp. D3-2-R+10]
MLIIVTGVSGTGKTTIGLGLADALDLPFFDADNFHPIKNIEKMSQGFPLNDEDRMPWLQSLADLLVKHEKTGGAVLACSALKESYREILKGKENVHWIHLKGDRDLIWRRMLARKNHYMKATMLDSQFATWEEPRYGLKLNILQTPEEMHAEAMRYLGVPVNSGN